MQGRQSRFADFLVDTLDIEPPEAWEFDADERRKWRELGAQYRLYPELERGARQRLVAETRRWLYQMRKQLEPPPAPKSKLPYFGKTELTLDRPLQFLKGIGPKSAEKLAKLHLLTAEDALHYFPRDHVNYANRQAIARAEVGTTITIVGQVRSCTCFTSPRNKNLSIFTLKVRDDSGSMQLSRFFAGRQFSNRGWQERTLRQYPRGATIAASGLVKHSKYGITLDDPQIEVLADETADIRSLKIGKILPIYPLTEGIDANLVRKAVQAALPAVVCLEDPMPEALRRSLDLLGLQQAIAGFHFPTDNDHLERARRRLVFDEFFYLQLGLLLRRQQYRQQSAEVPRYAPRDGDLLQKFYDILPFPLTNAQRRVVDELLADMRATDPMNRLVQGDVGAGKTVVAVAALLAAIQSGWQTTLMAPTEVLAEQHYRKLVEWFGQLHVPVELLTGSTPTAKRREILRQLETGEL
ncbi:MAG: DEAD/DEAH box helicase, partial [Cyanobacteria bacterium P01_F01_bin.33]